MKIIAVLWRVAIDRSFVLTALTAFVELEFADFFCGFIFFFEGLDLPVDFEFAIISPSLANNINLNI